MKKTYKIAGMNCDSCAKMIELDLEEININGKCSFSKSELTVDIGDKSQEKKVIEIVKKAGYSIQAI
ncbi:cation transporter [Candidatus Microgenomates bacterium]|nr:cation transporter [Candidatus Microgenomates bacterium]